MSAITEYYEQAEFALAAYFNLTSGISGKDYTDALTDGGKGMSATQASSFASKWIVADQYTDLVTGLSATVFKDVSDPDGPGYLAIRGTDGLRDIIGADLDLAAGVPMELDLGAAA